VSSQTTIGPGDVVQVNAYRAHSRRRTRFDRKSGTSPTDTTIKIYYLSRRHANANKKHWAHTYRGVVFGCARDWMTQQSDDDDENCNIRNDDGKILDLRERTNGDDKAHTTAAGSVYLGREVLIDKRAGRRIRVRGSAC
jgi:hypothetical protein